MKIPCPFCDYDNINLRDRRHNDFGVKGEQYTKCSECGCHYTYEVIVKTVIHVDGVV